MKKNKTYTLVETFSGKEIATSENLYALRDEISENLVEFYSVMSTEGWCAPATILFKKPLKSEDLAQI